MSLTYAIGDVHGRLDLLQALLEAIGTDAGVAGFASSSWATSSIAARKAGSASIWRWPRSRRIRAPG
jgi:hypothetical protein